MATFSIRQHLWWRAKKLAPKVMRLSLFLTAVYVVVLLVVARRAKADITEILMGMGPEIMRYDEARSQDAPRTLYLNGARVRFASGMTDRPVHTVLDFYERKCAQRGGQLDAQLREMIALQPGAAAETVDTSEIDGTLREETERRGFVACLDLGDDRVDPQGLLGRFTEFLDSGDLSRVGHMRYVFAERSRNGGAHFVVFWSEGELNLFDMFPAAGDAPGQDPPDVPRPEGSRRILSAWEHGEPASMTIYAGGRRDAASLERWYRKRLTDDGWRILDRGHATRVQAELRDARAMVIERGDSMSTVVLATGDDGKGVATVLVSR